MSDEQPTAESLRELADQKRWAELLVTTERFDDDEQVDETLPLFHALALMRLGRPGEAIAPIRTGLTRNPSSDWGNYLLFEALLAAGNTLEAFMEFKRFIEAHPGTDGQKNLYVLKAAELELFDLAGAMNRTRPVICDVPPRPRYALTLQCFMKADTLTLVLESLVGLARSRAFSLFIITDGVSEAFPAERRAACEAVRELIGAWMPRLVQAFHSVEWIENDRTMGTAPTLRRVIDQALRTHAGFMAIEDDCVLAPSALAWAEHHLDHTIDPLGVWVRVVRVDLLR